MISISALIIAIIVIIIILGFEFINGMHDAANAIATVVATRVLTPNQAVSLSAAGNMLGAFVFTTGVALTGGKGIVNVDIIEEN